MFTNTIFYQGTKENIKRFEQQKCAFKDDVPQIITFSKKTIFMHHLKPKTIIMVKPVTKVGRK